MNDKPKIDWSLSSCCGQKVVKEAGIPRCPKCRREIRTHGGEQRLARFEQHERAFDREHPKDTLRGRLDRPLDID